MSRPIFTFIILSVSALFTVAVAQTEEKTDQIISPTEFIKEVKSDLSKAAPSEAEWVDDVFAPLFLSPSSTCSIQDTVILTVERLRNKNITCFRSSYKNYG